MQTKLQTMIGQVIDTILPPRCVISGEIVEQQGMLSGPAWSELDFIAQPFCKRCGFPFDFDSDMMGADETHCAPCLKDKPEFKIARSVLTYNDASRNVILSFKHGDQIHLVRAFTPWLRKIGAEILKDADILIPVPLHRWRIIKRRYNQAALISHSLAKETGILNIPDALIRTRATASQGHLKHNERSKNVRRAFMVNKRHSEILKGKTAILIDDVYTTGATVRECTKTLLKQGVKEVRVLTLARIQKSGYV